MIPQGRQKTQVETETAQEAETESTELLEDAQQSEVTIEDEVAVGRTGVKTEGALSEDVDSMVLSTPDEFIGSDTDLLSGIESEIDTRQEVGIESDQEVDVETEQLQDTLQDTRQDVGVELRQEQRQEQEIEAELEQELETEFELEQDFPEPRVDEDGPPSPSGGESASEVFENAVITPEEIFSGELDDLEDLDQP